MYYLLHGTTLEATTLAQGTRVYSYRNMARATSLKSEERTSTVQALRHYLEWNVNRLREHFEALITLFISILFRPEHSFRYLDDTCLFQCNTQLHVRIAQEPAGVDHPKVVALHCPLAMFSCTSTILSTSTVGSPSLKGTHVHSTVVTSLSSLIRTVSDLRLGACAVLLLVLLWCGLVLFRPC